MWRVWHVLSCQCLRVCCKIVTKELVRKKEKGGTSYVIWPFTFGCNFKNFVGLFQPIQVHSEIYVSICLNLNH